MVSNNEIFPCFTYISLCKISDTGTGPFLPQGHNLNKPFRGSVGEAIPNIKAIGIMVSDMKTFHVFPNISLC